MNNYAIYTFEVNEREVHELFPMEQSPETDNDYVKFERIFGRKGTTVVIKKEKRQGEGADSFPCHVLAHEDNIILLRLENVKKKSIYEMHQTVDPVPHIQKKTYDSNPPCNVIIDNREDRAQIAIEIKKDAWSETNAVRDLLEESLNRMLEPLKLGIEIKSKLQTSSYWDFVTYRQKKEGRSITKMTFNFPNAKIRSDITSNVELSPNLKKLMDMIDALGGEKGELTVQASKKQNMLANKRQDIKNMVKLCTSSEYSLSVTFDDNITYRCNESIRAELPLTPDNAVTNFEQGQRNTTGEYDIETWLDWVVKQTEKYKDAEQVRPKPNRSCKRKVS